MKLRFSNEWLKEQILRDGDVEVEAGFPLLDSAPLNRFVLSPPLPADPAGISVLHVLVHKVRRRDGLSLAQFADRIRVELSEIEKIETIPGFMPMPRTLHQLAQYLGVPARAVQSLTADAVVRNDNLEDAVTKFAASSDDLSSLSRAERRSLNEFVNALANYDKAK